VVFILFVSGTIDIASTSVVKVGGWFTVEVVLKMGEEFKAEVREKLEVAVKVGVEIEADVVEKVGVVVTVGGQCTV